MAALGVTLGFVPLTLIDPPAYRLTNFPISIWGDRLALQGFEDFTGASIRLSLNQPQGVAMPPAPVLLALGFSAAGARASWEKRTPVGRRVQK